MVDKTVDAAWPKSVKKNKLTLRKGTYFAYMVTYMIQNMLKGFPIRHKIIPACSLFLKR
jgi:hypothetical protein